MSRNIYQKGFSVLKNHVTRTVAVTFCMVALLLLGYIIQEICASLWGIRPWIPGLVGNWNVLSASLTGGWLACLYLFLSPFEAGIKRWFYISCKDEPNDFRLIFSGFADWSTYWKSLRIRFLLSVSKVLISIVCLLPAFSMYRIVESLVSGGMFRGAAVILQAVLFLVLAAGLLAAFWINLRYFLVYYLWFENPQIPVSKLVRLSIEKMKSGRRETLHVYLALIPFFLLLVFIIPLFALIPVWYILTSLQGLSLADEMREEIQVPEQDPF